jgi:hypothetical protein
LTTASICRSITCSVDPESAFRQRLADAEDRHEPGGLRRQEFQGDAIVRFGVVLAALANARQHERAADIAQHRARDLAGECALRVLAQVLSTEAEAAGDVALRQRCDVRERRQQRDVGVGRQRRCDGPRRARRPSRASRASSSFRRRACGAWAVRANRKGAQDSPRVAARTTPLPRPKLTAIRQDSGDPFR